MLIRSQRKRFVVVLESIDSLGIQQESDNMVIYAYKNGGEYSIALGRYTSYEVAIKVLDEITETFQYCKEWECGVRDGIRKPEFVYQMPEQ